MRFKDKYWKFCKKHPTCDECPLSEYEDFCANSFTYGILIDIIEGNIEEADYNAYF